MLLAVTNLGIDNMWQHFRDSKLFQAIILKNYDEEKITLLHFLYSFFQNFSFSDLFFIF